MENYGRLDPATGLNSRLKDFLSSLDEALDGALAARVDLLVIAGDVYKSRDPSPTHQREFARRIRRIVDAGVQVFIVAGNHDIPLSAGRASSVEIFRALDVRGVSLARTVGVQRIETPAGPVQVLAFPWTVRSHIVAQPEMKNKTIAELNEAMVQLNRAKLLADAQTLDPALPSILVGHAHVFGARVGAERLLTMGSDPVYDLSTFDLPGVDYVALGHIHKHQVLAYGDPPVVYPGSIDRVDFGEEGEDKGWVYVEVPEKGRANPEFRRVNARPFVTIDARVTGENPTEDVVRAIARKGNLIPDAVVKLRIDVPAERLPELRDDDIRAQLKGAFFLAPIERNVQRQTRQRVTLGGMGIQHAPPLDALSIYLAEKQLDPERREILLRYARHLVEPGAPAPSMSNGPSEPTPTPAAAATA